MIGRFRIGRWARLRLALGLLAIVMLIWVLTLARVTADRARDSEGDAVFPLPAQAAAIVELIEATPEADRALALAAVTSPDLKAILHPDAPPPDAPPEGAQRLPGVERVLGNYLDALGERPVAVYLATERGGGLEPSRFRLGERRLISSAPMRMEIGLADGGVLMLETQGELARRVYNWPLGLGAGLVSLVLAGLALATLWQELRPLGELGSRLDSYAAAARPEPMPEEGPETVRGVIAAFNRMQSRIAELLATRSAMLGALGHDLRTYLTRMRLRIEMIEDSGQRAKAERDLSEMGEILENALAFARIDAAALEIEPIDLATLVAEALDGAGVEDVDVAVEGARPALALGDRLALRRVLDNLFSNAQRHGGGLDHLRVERRGDRIVCRVADRGPGFPKGAARQRLLAPFTRGDAARTLDTPGSGLGLAIAARLVEAMGGGLSLDDWEGGGAAVIALPAA